MHRQSGFTLVEVMIAMAIFSVAIAMASRSFARAGQVATASALCGQMHQSMRHAMDVMTRDIHAAKRVITAHDDYYFGVIVTKNGSDTYVYYLVHNKNLYRFTVGGGEILATNIGTLGVELRDLDGNETTDVQETFLVEVRLRAEAEARGTTYTDSVETLIRLRNKQT
jgi:prepilin-type N-terminal cleavage/methylation domain-containing protein